MTKPYLSVLFFRSAESSHDGWTQSIGSLDNQNGQQNTNFGKNNNSLDLHSLTASTTNQTLLPLLRFIHSYWLYLLPRAKLEIKLDPIILHVSSKFRSLNKDPTRVKCSIFRLKFKRLTMNKKPCMVNGLKPCDNSFVLTRIIDFAMGHIWSLLQIFSQKLSNLFKRLPSTESYCNFRKKTRWILSFNEKLVIFLSAFREHSKLRFFI